VAPDLLKDASMTTTDSDVTTAPVDIEQCLLENSALRGENAALRQALRVNEAAASSLFARLLEAETEHPWIADALRRSEQRASDLESQLASSGSIADLERQTVALQQEIDRIYRTRTMRTVAPARRVWGTLRRLAGRTA
jgi:cell division septum initiation protein DivIVA